MALRIRFQYQTGAALGYSIERLSDGLFWDFAASGVGTGQSFTPSPGSLLSSLPEDAGIYAGRYKAVLLQTPTDQFTDGDYCVTIHDTANSNTVVAELVTTMHGGDDAPVFPSAADPWAVATGSHAAGTFGALVETNLDAALSSRVTAFTYTPPDNTSLASLAGSVGSNLNSLVNAIKAKTDNLPASPAAAGPVQLAANGLDAIVIEPGVNARQALVPILATACGQISGAGTNTIVIKGGNTTTTRITATVDAAGNRTAVALNLPS